MKLIYKSWFYKVMSVGRYFLLYLFYPGKFRCGQMSMIGEHCGIHIFKNGEIYSKGRIIIDDHVMLFAKGRLLIGQRFSINRYSRIVVHEKIEIGDDVTIGQGVAILDHDHQYSMTNQGLKLDGYVTQPVKIGSRVWIGDKCTVLKGVTIGDNVVVGANTLIHKDVPPGVVVGGVPFKILKKL